MAKYRLSLRSGILAVVLALVVVSAGPAPTVAGVEDWHKGASIRSSSPENYLGEAFREALQELADTNANFVTLILPLKQEHLRANEVYTVWATPSEEVLAYAIQYAHHVGLQVNLKPHLDEENYSWRARINPRDPDAWFRSYGSVLLDFARLAEEHGAEMITIGSELITLTRPEHTHRWRDLISQVREVYSGELTYSANWGGNEWSREADTIEFWNDLDYIGLAAYYYFNPPHNLGSLLSQWDRWDRRHVRPLYQKWGKPILFTEVGYRSKAGALQSPWDWSSDGRPDQATQALGYQALFEYWHNRDYFRGVHLWVWHNASNPDYWTSDRWATEYTPQRKEAQEVMERWFAIGAKPREDLPPAPPLPGEERPPSEAEEPQEAAPPPQTMGHFPTGIAVRTPFLSPLQVKWPASHLWPSAGW